MTAASEPMLACGDKEPRKALQMYSLTARPAGVTAALSVHAGQYEPAGQSPLWRFSRHICGKALPGTAGACQLCQHAGRHGLPGLLICSSVHMLTSARHVA